MGKQTPGQLVLSEVAKKTSVTQIMNLLEQNGHNIYFSARALRKAGYDVVIAEGLRYPGRKELVWRKDRGASFIQPWTKNMDDQRRGAYPQDLPFWVHAKAVTKKLAGFEIIALKHKFFADYAESCNEQSTTFLIYDKVVGYLLIEIETKKIEIEPDAAPLRYDR